MSTIERHGVTERYADAVVHAGVIHLVEVPSSSDTDITTQTTEVLASVDRQLTQLGSGRDRILHREVDADAADRRSARKAAPRLIPAAVKGLIFAAWCTAVR